MPSKSKPIPPRSKVKPADTWDLSSLFPNDEAWEEAFQEWEQRIPGYAQFQGKLGQDARTLAAALAFDLDLDRAGERLGTYAFLKTAEDTANSNYQRMQGRYTNAASRAGQAASYFRPEVMAIPAARMKRLPGRPAGWRPTGCCWSGSCGTSRTRFPATKSGSWPCRPRWPRRVQPGVPPTQ